MVAYSTLTTESVGWTVQLYEDSDKESLLRLSKLHYGEKDMASMAYLKWLYEDSPAGEPFVIVAKDNASGEVIGFLWYVAVTARVHGREFVCYMGCNALVHPDYRKQGVYTAIHTFFNPSPDVCHFIYGFPKHKTMSILERVNIFEVGRIPMLVRPLDIAAVSKTQLSNPALQTGLKLGWKLAGSTLLRPKQADGEKHGITVSVVQNFDERFDQFWEGVKDKYPVIIKRDSAFLNWRFSNSIFREYHAIAATVNGKVVGYAVLRSTKIGDTHTGIIMDLLVETGERGDAAGILLAEQATQWFHETGASLGAGIMLPHTQEYQILRQAGYVSIPEKVSPMDVYLVARSHSPDVPKEHLSVLDDWFVTMANHDVV